MWGSVCVWSPFSTIAFIEGGGGFQFSSFSSVPTTKPARTPINKTRLQHGINLWCPVMRTWCFQMLGSVWGGKRLHKQSMTENSNYWLSPWAASLPYFAEKENIVHGVSTLEKKHTGGAAWRTQLNGDKLVVSHRRFYAPCGRMFTSVRPVDPRGCLPRFWFFFLAESYRDTRGGEMFPRRVLQTLSWCLSAIERMRPRSSEKRSRPFVASRVCIVSDKDTLLHCSAGRGLRSSGGWMKGGSAQARTRRSDTSMKESKTDPKEGGEEEESQILLNKITVKEKHARRISGNKLWIRAARLPGKMSWE